jgi:hypothetical protein
VTGEAPARSHKPDKRGFESHSRNYALVVLIGNMRLFQSQVLGSYPSRRTTSPYIMIAMIVQLILLSALITGALLVPTLAARALLDDRGVEGFLLFLLGVLLVLVTIIGAVDLIPQLVALVHP